MTPERWQKVRRLFDAAVDLEKEKRAEFLSRATSQEDSLLADVDFLLRSHEAAGDFIERPYIRLAPSGEEEGAPSRTSGPRRLGPYELERVLGRGGMATVYLARRADEAYHHKVAVKVLRRELDSEELVRRFRSERQILAGLEHPSIARLLDGGTSEDGLPYLVMEYVEGEPLDRYCDARRWTIPQRIELFRKVCDAVHFAHQNLVIHRDLKPGNILVTETETSSETEESFARAKLLDFGIAKLLEPESFPETVVATEPGLAPMTPEYASPEQVLGSAITTASDVYSLGIVLYELLSGRRPPRPRDREKLRRVIREQEAPRLSSTASPEEARSADGENEKTEVIAARRGTDSRRLRRMLAGDLDNIVSKAMHREPARRYASAQELSWDLERYLAHLPVGARPDRLAYRAGKFLRRHRWGVSVAAAGLLLLVGFLTTLFDQRYEILNQKTRAEEVTGVLIELFEVSDPEISRGREITAREILSRGAEKIRRRFENQPDLKAEILETLGLVHLQLNAYEEAGDLLEQALDLRRHLHGFAHRSVASILLHLARLEDVTGAYGQAESLYKKALGMLSYRSDEPEVERGLSGLARVYRRQVRYDESTRLYRESLSMARRLFGEAHPRVASNLKNLGGLLRERGNSEAAKRHYQQALLVYRERFGHDHPEVAGLHNDLALVFHAEGEYKRAEKEYRTALEIQSGLYDEPNLSLATTRYNLASCLYDRDRYSEAEELCRRALEARRFRYGERHRQVAEALNLLGLIRRELRDYDDAEKLIREALDIWTETLGADHPEVAVGLANLAWIKKARGESGAAERLYRKALWINRAKHGDEHWHTAQILNNLARLHRQRGDLETAEEFYREALRIRRRLFGDDHPHVAETLHNLAVLLLNAEDAAAAEPLEREALRIYEAKHEAPHRTVGAALQSLASILERQGRAAEAEILARRALAIFADLPAVNDIWRLATRSVLGGSLAGQGRYAEAEEILLEAHAGLAEMQGAESTLTKKVQDRLIALYEAWGRPEKATEYMSSADI